MQWGNNLLCEGQGEAVFCCSDGVLCLHMGHVFCIGVVDGHNPVSHPHTGLSCLPTWGQLDRRRQKLDARDLRRWLGSVWYGSFIVYILVLRQLFQEKYMESKRTSVLVMASDRAEESERLGLTGQPRYFTQHNQEQALWVIMMSSPLWFTADGSRACESHSPTLQTETRCYKCFAIYWNDPPPRPASTGE